MSRSPEGTFPLALRASQAAAMLGVSERQLRQWVAEGIIHRPYRVRKNVVLFDAVTLASDWDRMKDRAELDFGSAETNERPVLAENPWDDLLKE